MPFTEKDKEEIRKIVNEEMEKARKERQAQREKYKKEHPGESCC